MNSMLMRLNQRTAEAYLFQDCSGVGDQRPGFDSRSFEAPGLGSPV